MSSHIINLIAARAGQLADEPIDVLRSRYPLVTTTEAELVKYCRGMRWSRGELIAAILLNEFEDTNE
jgi:hypothetical protein